MHTTTLEVSKIADVARLFPNIQERDKLCMKFTPTTVTASPEAPVRPKLGTSPDTDVGV
jgi:hypothetical protein